MKFVRMVMSCSFALYVLLLTVSSNVMADDLSIDSSYIEPDSNVRYLSESTIQSFGQETLQYVKAEIYARHGRRFNNTVIQNYFDSQAWYSGIYPAEYFDIYLMPDCMNEFETKNLKLIEKYLTERDGPSQLDSSASFMEKKIKPMKQSDPILEYRSFLENGTYDYEFSDVKNLSMAVVDIGIDPTPELIICNEDNAPSMHYYIYTINDSYLYYCGGIDVFANGESVYVDKKTHQFVYGSRLSDMCTYTCMDWDDLHLVSSGHMRKTSFYSSEIYDMVDQYTITNDGEYYSLATQDTWNSYCSGLVKIEFENLYYVVNGYSCPSFAARPEIADKYIDSFLGKYYFGVMDDRETDYSNPREMILYFDGDGNLCRYDGLKYATDGTSFYYTYDNYYVNGNILSCEYTEESSVYGIIDETKPGVHDFVLANENVIFYENSVLYKQTPDPIIPEYGQILTPLGTDFKNGDYSGKNTFLGIDSIKRNKIQKIIFENTFQNRTESYWDVSAAGDESVCAWFAGKGELHIGGANGITAGTDMSCFFRNCKHLKYIDFGNVLDTRRVRSMQYCFAGCEKLETITGWDNWDTTLVLHFDHMFSNCRSLKELDLSMFNTASADNMRRMFYNCKKLTDLNLTSFRFDGCTDKSLVKIDPMNSLTGSLQQSLQQVFHNNRTTISQRYPMYYFHTCI